MSALLQFTFTFYEIRQNPRPVEVGFGGSVEAEVGKPRFA
jgi:hypothetical protein